MASSTLRPLSFSCIFPFYCCVTFIGSALTCFFWVFPVLVLVFFVYHVGFGFFVYQVLFAVVKYRTFVCCHLHCECFSVFYLPWFVIFLGISFDVFWPPFVLILRSLFLPPCLIGWSAVTP